MKESRKYLCDKIRDNETGKWCDELLNAQIRLIILLSFIFFIFFFYAPSPYGDRNIIKPILYGLVAGIGSGYGLSSLLILLMYHISSIKKSIDISKGVTLNEKDK